MADGETPQSINIVSYDDNVDKLKPGDRAEIVGVYRAQPLRIQKSRRETKSIFNVYIDLISSKITMDNRYKISDKCSTEFDDKQIQAFHKASQDPNIINRLINSFAPSIFGC